MSNDLPIDVSDNNVVSDDIGQVQPPASYAPTPEQGGFAPAPEQVETITPETLVVPEILVSAPESVVEEAVTEEVPVPVAAPVTPVPNVVDKRVHKVADAAPLNTTQKLTTKADEEEADFIEHVEEIHSTN
jgi:hypothetical protein